jgi:beta-mannosidase
MPRWPEQDGLEVRRLEGFAASGPLGDTIETTFSLSFRAPPLATGESAALAFDGIATVFAVSLNGSEILRGASMFAAYEVDVTALLREDNRLEIRCLALSEHLAVQPKRPRQRWRTKVADNGGALRFVRTSVLGRAPGFAPGPPIVGPWRPVWIVRRRGVVVEDIALRPRVEGADGVLAVSARMRGAGRSAGAAAPPDAAETAPASPPRAAGLPARAELEVAGMRAALAVDPDGRVHGEARIPGVQRWWPHTHGAPALHEVALLLDGERRVGLGRTGFRALSPGPEFDVDRDALALAVNGVPIFARGVVWTPVPEDEVRATLTTLRDAGINLVRLPGIGVYEDAAFHDLCDELGLLVWQDFMLANLDYPIEDEDFRAAITREARAALAGIAGRPSLAVVCGNSEVEQQAAMFGVDAALGRGELFGALLPALVRESGAGVPYIPSAPAGGALPFQPRAGVANYFGVGGYRRPLSDARTAGVRFASECLALANVPDAAVADGEGVMRDAGADWDFADVRDHYLRERYRVDPDALRDADRERYLALSREVSGEIMALVFGEWRRPASPCAGGIVLWARDLAPGAGWGVLDHAGAPKVALAHLRRALSPRALWIVDEGLNGLDVHVANDRPEQLDAQLHVALLADGTHAIAEATAALRVDGHGSAVCAVEALLGRFADAGYAYRFGPPAHDAVVATLRTPSGEVISQATHFPTGPPLEPTAFTLTAKPASAAAPAVVLTTDRLAWGVRISAPGFVAADDAFTLAPGTPRTIALRPLAPGARFGGATVTALNLIGESPVVASDVAA